MTLAELVSRVEQRAADAAAIHATAPVATIYRALLDELAAVDGVGDAPTGESRLLTAAEVAAQLGVAPRWVYVHASRLPFTRRLSDRVVRFDAAGLATYLARRNGTG